MDLNALKNFIVIVQSGSLLAAANRLGTAVSTLSRRMNELEKQLGLQLLERTSQGVTLTPAGQRCYELSLANLIALDEIEQQIRGDQTQLKGKLRLSIPQAFTYLWPIVKSFQEQHPFVEIHIISTDRKLDLIADGIDLAVRAGGLQTDKFIAKKLIDIRLKLVASPEFINKYGIPSSPEQLANYHCASWSAISQESIIWQLNGISYYIQPSISTNDYYHLKNIALSSNAICDLPDFFAQSNLQQGKLVEVLPNFAFPTMPVHLLYPSHRYQSSIVRAFIDFCTE